MGNTTNVVKFFNAKEIEDKRCDMEKPFAFISYSHEDNNAQKVMAIFKGLYEKGINLWIDVYSCNRPRCLHRVINHVCSINRDDF